MSEPENLQVVHRIYDAFSAGDLTAILNLMDDDVDWFFSARRRSLERDRVADVATSILTADAGPFDVEAFQPDEFLLAGDIIVVLGHERMKMCATGHLVEANWADIWRLRQGRVVRFREYSDTTA